VISKSYQDVRVGTREEKSKNVFYHFRYITSYWSKIDGFRRFHPPQSRLKPSQREGFPWELGYDSWSQKNSWWRKRHDPVPISSHGSLVCDGRTVGPCRHNRCAANVVYWAYLGRTTSSSPRWSIFSHWLTGHHIGHRTKTYTYTTTKSRSTPAHKARTPSCSILLYTSRHIPGSCLPLHPRLVKFDSGEFSIWVIGVS